MYSNDSCSNSLTLVLLSSPLEAYGKKNYALRVRPTPQEQKQTLTRQFRICISWVEETTIGRFEKLRPFPVVDARRVQWDQLLLSCARQWKTPPTPPDVHSNMRTKTAVMTLSACTDSLTVTEHSRRSWQNKTNFTMTKNCLEWCQTLRRTGCPCAELCDTLIWFISCCCHDKIF